LRTYNGYSFDFESIAKELYRVTKNGGVVVWVVGDATIKGSETGTSFKQALYFNEIGFNLHDTMIYQKKSCYAHDPRNKRYKTMFEYMFVFSKGKPKTYNEIKDVPNIHAGKILKGTKGRDKKGNKRHLKEQIISDFQARSNIWLIPSSGRSEHPAIFPEQLANDHIISWSNENDLIYDPFMGSGTTAKMAILNNRKYIGSEISEEYCKIIETRIKECGGLFFNSFETGLSNEAGT
jgi:site-specific DNA-methyltransferase (adenine-specific)